MIGSKLELSDITFSIECLPEYIPVRGNCIVSGDDEYDKEIEDGIIERLDLGDMWAWCCVKVSGTYKGLTAYDTLGACSYEGEREFREGGYYLDMQTQVLNDLQSQLDDIIEGVRASGILYN